MRHTQHNGYFSAQKYFECYLIPSATINQQKVMEFLSDHLLKGSRNCTKILEGRSSRKLIPTAVCCLYLGYEAGLVSITACGDGCPTLGA